jgi:hypothetical protein
MVNSFHMLDIFATILFVHQDLRFLVTALSLRTNNQRDTVLLIKQTRILREKSSPK